MIKSTKLQKTVALGKRSTPLRNLKNKDTFKTKSRSRFFRSQYESATHLTLADELDLSSKSVHITESIHKCRKMYECISVVIKVF